MKDPSIQSSPETAPVLANENLRPFYKLFLKTEVLLKSMAVFPPSAWRIPGSLNLGMLPERYSAGMDYEPASAS